MSVLRPRPWLVVLPAALVAGILGLSLWLSASVHLAVSPQANEPSGAVAPQGGPRRVVSLDYCADQFVLELLPREAIRALSPDAGSAFSFWRARAAGLPTVRPVAEDVLALRPGVIVRSYGGGPKAAAFFEQAGVPVVQIGFAGSIDEVKAGLQRVAAALGVAQRAQARIRELERRLARIERPERPPQALYLTPAGVTSGRGTLVDDILQAAGFENYQTRPGWHPLPLERLVYEDPDRVAAAFFGLPTNHADRWSATRHPVAQRTVRKRPVTMLEGAWTACGGWFLIHAVEALATDRRGASNTGRTHAEAPSGHPSS